MSSAILGSTDVFPPLVAESVRQAVAAFFTSILGEAPVETTNSPATDSCSGVVGVISLVGDGSWIVALALPSATASAVSEKFCGFEIPFDAAEMGDVVGELSNVLGGEIAAHFDARGLKAQLSLPMVARGDNVEVMLPEGLPDLQLNYSCRQGDFWIKVAAARPGHCPGRRPGT